MQKILLATDLDNTLIHSYKHKTSTDICVEYIDNKEQSFMTNYTYKRLSLLSKTVDIIPITSRTIAQYNRIKFPDNCINKAITTNGVFLLENEQVTLILTDENIQYDNLCYLKNMIEKESKAKVVNLADNMYLYVSCETILDAQYIANKYYYKTIINPIISGRKIYFIPEYYSKGKALQKLMKNYDLTIAAGDSELDVSMLNTANIAIIPKNLINKVNNSHTYVCNNMNFSNFIIDILMTILFTTA